MILFIDIESRSLVDLKVVGVPNYARHPSTQVLMMAWAVDQEPSQLWQSHIADMPERLASLLQDDTIQKCAWNATFERNIIEHVLHIPIPIASFTDAMVHARFLSLPGGLGKAGVILGLEEAQQKMRRGNALIKLFCRPSSAGGEESLFGATQPAFYDWRSKRREWREFCDYCLRDVEAEREIYRRISTLPPPAQEILAFRLDQKINERGLPVNMKMVSNSIAMANRSQRLWQQELRELTDLPNPDSRDQILAWVTERGYPYKSLRKEFVQAALSDPNSTLTIECREALTLRQDASKTSFRKLETIQDRVSADGRLRNQFVFYGAARSGRWTGNGVQPQNLPRPSKAVGKNLLRALEVIEQQDTEAADREFGSVIELVTGCVRSAFQAPPGHKLVVCDLSAIENRVLAWLAGARSMLKVFQDNLDPYISFATKMYKQSYEELLAEYHAGQTHKRQVSKSATLGCGFGLGGGEDQINGAGDRVKTGLWGYAENMGIQMTREEAHTAVSVFRASYHELPRLWKALEFAARESILDCKRMPHGPISFLTRKRANGTKLMQLILPSGRPLYYFNARIERTTKDQKEYIAYDGIGHGVGATEKGSRWSTVHTYGGKLCENSVQAIARDILLNGMFLADEKGLQICGHVHDEVIVESPAATADEDLNTLRTCMETVPTWAPDLPLKAEGYVSTIYHK